MSRRAVVEVSTQVLAVFAAGTFYVLTGGLPLSGDLTLADALRFLGMFGTYSAAGVVAHWIMASERRKTVGGYARWLKGRGVVVEIALLPLSLLLAAAYMPSGSATFPLLVVVLLVSSAAGKTLWSTKQTLERHVRDLDTINATAQAVSSTLRLDELVVRLEESTRELFGSTMVTVCLYDEEKGDLDYRVCIEGTKRIPAWRSKPGNTFAGWVIAHRRSKPGNTFAGWVIAHRETLLVADIADETETRELDSRLASMAKSRGVEPRAWAGIPLLARDRLVGVLAIESREPKAFGEQDVELLVTIGGQVAHALENARLYENVDEAKTKVESWGKTLEQKVEERTAELQKARADLEALNQDLEQRVEERTRDLQRMQEKVVQSGRLAAVGELAAGVAHELNNPLGGILGYAQYDLERIISRGKGGLSPEEVEKLVKHLGSIEQASQRCRSIVQSLLTFSRSSQGSFTEISVSDVLVEAIHITEHQLGMRGIKLEQRVDEALPEVTGDQYQLRQVFANIILNARDAMPSGGTLTICAARAVDARGNASVEIVFTDSGCGISAEDLGRVFEPFFTTHDTGDGSGLGLAVSYGIVKDHGGQIEVESQPGEGSVFTVRLPHAGAEARLHESRGA